jgi:hypothetical protein
VVEKQRNRFARTPPHTPHMRGGLKAPRAWAGNGVCENVFLCFREEVQ